MKREEQRAKGQHQRQLQRFGNFCSHPANEALARPGEESFFSRVIVPKVHVNYSTRTRRAVAEVPSVSVIASPGLSGFNYLHSEENINVNSFFITAETWYLNLVQGVG